MKHYNVLVIGAGPAGIAAAIQAARSGSACAVVEKNGMPGGTITAAGIASPGLFAVAGRRIIAGIGWELVEKTLRECGSPKPDLTRWDPVFWKNQIDIDPVVFAAVCDREMIDAGVELLYHTMLGALENDNNRWRVTLCGKEGLYDVTADIVIDCTGDGNAAALAGCRMVDPPCCQPGTYSVRLSGTAGLRPETELAGIFAEECRRDAVRASDLGWCKGYSTLFYSRGGVNGNHIAVDRVYSSRGRTNAEVEGRAAVLRAYRFLKQHGGCKDLQMSFAASECGIRESRTILGETTVSDMDYRSGRLFPDALCYAWYPMDRHEADSVNAEPLDPKVIPTVPRGALLPKNSSRIAAAGRIISAEPGAGAGLRIQAVCFATGQACGAMAHLAASSRREMKELPLSDIRDLLRKHGAIVPDPDFQS